MCGGPAGQPVRLRNRAGKGGGVRPDRPQRSLQSRHRDGRVGRQSAVLATRPDPRPVSRQRGCGRSRHHLGPRRTLRSRPGSRSSTRPKRLLIGPSQAHERAAPRSRRDVEDHHQAAAAHLLDVVVGARQARRREGRPADRRRSPTAAIAHASDGRTNRIRTKKAPSRPESTGSRSTWLPSNGPPARNTSSSWRVYANGRRS